MSIVNGLKNIVIDCYLNNLQQIKCFFQQKIGRKSTYEKDRIWNPMIKKIGEELCFVNLGIKLKINTRSSHIHTTAHTQKEYKYKINNVFTFKRFLFDDPDFKCIDNVFEKLSNYVFKLFFFMKNEFGTVCEELVEIERF